MVRALITGASGFAGRALVAHLKNAGDEVIPWSRAGGDPDITNRSAVLSAVRTTQPDVIYHLAAQSNVPAAWDDPEETARINVIGTQNVLDAASGAGEPRVLVISSAAVYGSVDPSELPITEASPLRATNPYAQSKVDAERAAVASQQAGLDVVRIRAFNHFGPGQRTSFASSGFAHRIAKASQSGERVIEVGSLAARRDFTDVRDVVGAYRKAATDGASGAVYNVCSGVDRSMQEIANGLVERSGADISFVVSADLQRPAETPILRGSAAALHQQTSWAPEIPFEKSLDDIYDDALANLANGQVRFGDAKQ